MTLDISTCYVPGRMEYSLTGCSRGKEPHLWSYRNRKFMFRFVLFSRSACVHKAKHVLDPNTIYFPASFWMHRPNVHQRPCMLLINTPGSMLYVLCFIYCFIFGAKVVTKPCGPVKINMAALVKCKQTSVCFDGRGH
jgi:hypothetical protein